MNKDFKFSKIINNNTLLFIFSIICSAIIWFIMEADSITTLPKTVSNVPITIKLSDSALEGGLKIFDQNIEFASVSIAGNSLITDKVSANEIEVVGNLSPAMEKVTGKTMQKETINLSANKKSSNLTDYEISSVTPSVITVYYDRYREQTFDIENEVKYSSNADFHVDLPVFTSNLVKISGPESSVTQISRVSINKDLGSNLSESANFTSELTIYDQNDNILDKNALFLTLDVETVDVEVNVSSKKTVNLVANNLNLPKGFSESRIVIEPATIEIVGDADIISQYQSITLPTPIDFKKIDLQNNTLTVDIPMPEKVRNISNIYQATITINLNGFTKTTTDINSLSLTNVPDGKEVVLVEQSLIGVTIITSTAQKPNISPETVVGTIDMAGKADTNAEIQVPVIISIPNIDSTWSFGEYYITVRISDKVAPVGLLG